MKRTVTPIPGWVVIGYWATILFAVWFWCFGPIHAWRIPPLWYIPTVITFFAIWWAAGRLEEVAFASRTSYSRHVAFKLVRILIREVIRYNNLMVLMRVMLILCFGIGMFMTYRPYLMLIGYEVCGLWELVSDRWGEGGSGRWHKEFLLMQILVTASWLYAIARAFLF